MAMPLFRPKASTPEPDEEEVVIVEEAEDESPAVIAKVPAVRKPLAMPRVMPAVVGVTLDDEQVEQEMEKAVNRTSSFGYQLDHIRSHLDNKDYQQASLVTKEAILKTLIELIPMAESSLRKSKAKNGIYQFNSLVNQVREMLTELDGERDLSAMVQSIMDDAIRPTIMTLAQMVIQFNNSLKRQLRAELDAATCKRIDPLIDEQVRELGQYIQSMFNDIQVRVNRKVDGM